MKNKLNMREILNIAAKVIPWCYTNTQNLGQRYPGTGTRKYKSTNEKGEPTVVEKVTILPPQSMMGSIDDGTRLQ